MKQLIIVVIMLCLFYHADAQQPASIKGNLQDTVSLKSVAFSSVLVINPTDSLILGFTHCNERGEYIINNLPAKKVRLLITRPGFADYEDFLTLSEGQITDVGMVNMISKTTLLQEVIIRDRIDAIRIKGDTTEFLVDSFLTNKHASVEELMKKLPGIQVDKDGKITAQGKEVKKVLVDGEEFFGDDPTIATKNIKATQVESIQVFDKKSEQATISGIDDGVSDKTINLKLKEDAKKGYFGKVSAGVA
nr:TonB-dependent receptor [Bacteroidia bacterium]